MVLGERARFVPISATKSMLGHTIGASGAIEVAVTALSIHHHRVTPTINLDEPDPECDLNYIPNVPISQSIRVALSNSFGFGGNNCCIALSH
jgi:3-oxoacyl-[acyl-carrier-protein] synthase II